jgi:plastocyanin
MRSSHRFVLAAFVAVVGCSKGSNESAPPPPAPTTASTPTINANTNANATAAAAPTPAANGPKGTIEGVVKFTGTVPAAKPIDKITDPVCAAAKPVDAPIVVGKDKGLKDVLVRIEVGGAQGTASTETPILKQEGCEYVPRVIGVVAGEDIEIMNADKTMHNVHTYKGNETMLNAGQPAGAQPIKKPASDEAAILKVKCDVHPWMTAYIVVTDHPFFATTDADGHFSIPNVPAGTYRIEAFHPELGTIEKKDVTVGAGAPIDPQLVFTGAEKKTN